MAPVEHTATKQRARGSRLRRWVVTSCLVIAAIFIAGPALAYFSTTGTGAGAAGSATTVPVTLSPGTPSAALYPGGQSSVVLAISNPNSATIHISTLALATAQGTGGWAVDVGHSGCSVTSVSFTTQTNGGAGWTVPAKVGAVNGTLSVTLPSAVTMGLSASNACQNATFTVYLAAS